ncbi:type IV toxin-antitoxin system AbiEi family antitoxin domain-containing protein [Sporosarcina sp. P33]|uniref:type IV toxin-antitoxin system AbiEi family antitoxin domain-containing protein n=1 Tax=Sporosarcina sp. P33 TaxID=1930764 RepID=UPI0009BE2C95|nr:type IV toxin-antitoxin system AbiEi family antitoxin domain-containing protein [Sporosarcina sp. P33]ARD47584.1 hypothetical protein SporoP33_04590 [Sporosarcina sp. P33]
MSGKGLKERNYLVSTDEICEIMGLSARRIQQLVDEKAIVRASHGKYDLVASVRSFNEYTKNKLIEEDADLDKLREETLWIRARRMKSEAEYNIMSGELHRSSDVEEVMNKMMEFFRSQLLSLPTRSAGKVLGETDINAIRETLRSDIKELMTILSDYDPAVFYEQSDDKIYVESPEEAGVVERK